MAYTQHLPDIKLIIRHWEMTRWGTVKRERVACVARVWAEDLPTMDPPPRFQRQRHQAKADQRLGRPFRPPGGTGQAMAPLLRYIPLPPTR